ncbi:MAG: hypothetical protein K1W26_12380 [Acetatifactor sp.]
MKRGGNGNRKNLLFVCGVVTAAVVFVVSTMRFPETGGEATVHTAQTVQNVSVPGAGGGDMDTPSGESAADMPESATDMPEPVADMPEPVADMPESAADMPESVEAILGDVQSAQWVETPQVQLYSFRNERLLNQHYEKHGIEMGFATIEEYVAAANAVINHPDVLHKQEAEDNDDVYFLEATNEFVVVSTDGYIRTYFIASGGIDYYNRQ